MDLHVFLMFIGVHSSDRQGSGSKGERNIVCSLQGHKCVYTGGYEAELPGAGQPSRRERHFHLPLLRPWVSRWATNGGLAPADYDYTTATYLTSSVLNHWLHESKCKARRVLFTLDCCYAGGLAEELTSGDIELRPGLYVLSACTAFETSLVVGPLGHSIFAYFLAYALRVSPFPPGKLPIAQVFKECGTLCTALSSLLISYTSTFSLKFGTMQPELRHTVDLHSSVISWVEESLKLTPGSLHPEEACHREKYDFVMRYCKKLSGLHQHQLSELCLKWVEYVADTSSPTSPLAELARRNLLNNEVLCAAVCSIMWSVASIQMEEDRSNVNTSEMFLLGFLHTAAAIECFGGSELTLKHLKASWEFYQAVLGLKQGGRS